VADHRSAAGRHAGLLAGNRCTWPFASVLEDLDHIREIGGEERLEMPSLGTYVSCAAPDDVDKAMRAARLSGSASCA